VKSSPMMPRHPEVPNLIINLPPLRGVNVNTGLRTQD